MKTIFILFVLTIMLTASKHFDKENKKDCNKKIVTIYTDYGEIKIKLYKKTPLHSENFLKLAEKGFYDSTLFHRIIPEFMIQGGDPDSKNADISQMLGDGGPGYNIPAEFVPEYFHKKGVIAAARMSDNENPKKESSGSQFYLVVGKVFSQEDLDKLEQNMNNGKKREFLINYIERPENELLKKTIDSLRINKDKLALTELANKLEGTIDSLFAATENEFKFTAEQRKIYTSVGGTPHLDGSYTVFGEVIEGMEVVDSISKVDRDKFDRPLKDIAIRVTVK